MYSDGSYLGGHEQLAIDLLMWLGLTQTGASGRGSCGSLSIGRPVGFDGVVPILLLRGADKYEYALNDVGAIALVYASLRGYLAVVQTLFAAGRCRYKCWGHQRRPFSARFRCGGGTC